MAKKMYYNEQEAADALGVSVEDLDKYVRDDKLRVFQDGEQRMFKADEVDALSGGGGEEEIELTPAAETPPAETPADQVSLTEADQAPEKPAGKDDTVITAEGISIFDDEDLEIEAVDPMAKTTIAPSMDEQAAAEGVGSGSGLLDLTRESDDTSLGAEVLDQIDMESGLSSGLASAEAAEPAPAQPAPAAAPAVAAAPADLEVTDPASGLFGGIVVGCAIVFVVLSTVMLAVWRGVLPTYLKFMKEQMAVVIAGSVIVITVAAVAGLMVSKAAAARRRAMGSMGG
jgi:hypothetical protein